MPVTPSTLITRFKPVLLAALLLLLAFASGPSLARAEADGAYPVVTLGHSHSRRRQARYLAAAQRALADRNGVNLVCDAPSGCRVVRRTLRRLMAWRAGSARSSSVTLEPAAGRSRRAWARVAALNNVRVAPAADVADAAPAVETVQNAVSGRFSIDLIRLLSDFAAARAAGVRYRFGAKADPDTPPAALRALDCSGWAGYSLERASGRAVRLAGLGTAQMARRLRSLGVPTCAVDEGARRDGAVRLAITLAGGRRSVGHCALVYDGTTLESSSSSGGVDRKPWNGRGWQRDAVVFVLTPPPAA